jgi:hypothetical protein
MRAGPGVPGDNPGVSAVDVLMKRMIVGLTVAVAMLGIAELGIDRKSVV